MNRSVVPPHVQAVEDAQTTQAAVAAFCAASGRAVPPYVLTKLIGQGSSGRVYKAEGGGGKEEAVAVKIIHLEGDKPGDRLSDMLQEIRALKRLSEDRARNISRVLDALLVGSAVWMVTELCAGASVAALMRPTGRLQERWLVPILREVAEALFWAHGQGILHRDVQCSSVLVTAAGDVRLGDFAVAADQLDKLDDAGIDIWAFGAMACEIASGRHAPRLEGDQHSAALRDLVASCLVPDPAQRPAIDQVQRHPYLAHTAETHPTRSLAALVSACRLWQEQGGDRLALSSPRDAQGDDTDDDVFALDASADEAVGPPSSLHHRRRRRPPAPLESQTLFRTPTSHRDHTPAVHGRGDRAGPRSDLPLRDAVKHPVRESFIDLDGDDDTDSADDGTLRAARRPQDWKFPKMVPAETDHRLGVPSPAAASNRHSALSLIDLDASLVTAPSQDGPLTKETPRTTREPLMSLPDSLGITAPLPPVPHPPSSTVLAGRASRHELADELARLIGSLSDHLQTATDTVNRLSVRAAR